MKTVNLAYKEAAMLERSGNVITMHTNEALLARYKAQYEKVELQAKPVYDVLKRAADIVCSAAAIAAFSPLLLGVAAAIMINDFGSPIYSQIRIGKDGQEFRIYKFRSMYTDADERKAALMAENESQGANFKIEHDPRITKVGAFLRKTSIDELPQLVNILKGDMSIIGPRPFIPVEQEELPDDRLLVKPGLSCYWQVSGGNTLSKSEQIDLDRRYIRERSLWTDLKLIGKTVLHVLGGKNC
jgi:lipopolysaccharide/colanic/teichoic acid biosynthesis glycosyltransferase